MIDKRKTLEDYLKNETHSLLQDESGNPRFFRGENFVYQFMGTEKNLREEIKRCESPLLTIQTRGYHKYTPGILGCILLSKCLNDMEVSETEHERYEQIAQEGWNRLSEEDKKKFVQWAYEDGIEVDEKDLITYHIS